MQTDSLCTIDDFDPDTIIPVEILPCDGTQNTRQQDAVSIVELGKQLLLNAKNGDTEMVRDLMCRGAPFTTDWLGTSALHLAAQNNHTETAEVLLRAGISRDARTKVDRTPLHLAAYEGHDQMARLLLNYGADVDSKDMLKMTPLHWAVEREHVEVIQALLEHGANPNASSKFDKTPITLALEHDRLDLVDVLQQEREIINVQQNREQSAEIEAATQNLMQLEADHQKDEQQRFELDDIHKRKLGAVTVSNKKQKMVFQQYRLASSMDEKPEKELERLEGSTEKFAFSKKHKDPIMLGGIDQPFRLLQAHGITMIPMDNEATIVENAMESGQTVVLTEAGKLALNLTRSSPINVKRLQMGSRKGTARKVITIRADQILGQSTQNLTQQRGPNILKRTSNDLKKAPKLILTSLGNSTLTARRIGRTENPPSPVKAVMSSEKVMERPVLLQLDDEIEEVPELDNEAVNDIALLNQKLVEARRQAEEYRKQLAKKEEEAEIYKQQLRNITARQSVK